MPRRPDPSDQYGGPPVRGRLLTVDDVALRLECTGRRVRMIPATELPYLALAQGGPRKYDPRDVDTYVRRRMIRG